MSKHRMHLLVLGFGCLCVLHAQSRSSSPQASIAAQIEETNRQRVQNQKLMWDAAADFGEAFQGFATNQGDPGTAANLARIREIGEELESAVSNDDPVRVMRLLNEGMGLLGLEALTRTSEIAESIANAVGVTESVPLNLWPAAQAYKTFRQRQADDDRLLQQIDTLRQRAATNSLAPAAKSRQALVDASNKAQAAANQCAKTNAACSGNCLVSFGGVLGPQLNNCIAACNNCAAENGAAMRATQALSDFDTRNASQRR